MNGYNFTHEVRTVLASAREEAVGRNHEYVGTEHLLLALIKTSEGVAAAVLLNLAVNLEKIRKTIDGIIMNGSNTPLTHSDLPYTSRAKKVLELGITEARDLSHDFVGTEHLLLGLIREEKGVAAQVLHQAGLTEQAARLEVRRLTVAAENVGLGLAPVVSVRVEVRLADGSDVRNSFPSIAAAVAFLTQR